MVDTFVLVLKLSFNARDIVDTVTSHHLGVPRRLLFGYNSCIFFVMLLYPYYI